MGFESGPQFFNSLGRHSVKEIMMAVVVALSGLITVVVIARVFGLDKGLAARLATGSIKPCHGRSCTGTELLGD